MTWVALSLVLCVFVPCGGKWKVAPMETHQSFTICITNCEFSIITMNSIMSFMTIIMI